MKRDPEFTEDVVEYISQKNVQFDANLTLNANAASRESNKCYFKVEGGRLAVADEPVDGTVQAYWCPYHADSGTPIMLSVEDEEPCYMFTAKMNGCTFDVAMAVDGSARVVHVNDSIASKGIGHFGKAIAAQSKAQREKSLELLGEIPDIGVDTSVGDQVRIVGVREGKKWAFSKIDSHCTISKLGHRQAELYQDNPHVGPSGADQMKDKKCIVM